MIVIDPGHIYDMYGLDTDEVQRLVFVKREGKNYPGNVGTHAGLLTQEVLRALLHRCKYMNAQGSCAETDLIISNLRNALLLFEVRAARCRGASINLASIVNIEDEPVCEKCGHIQCDSVRHSKPHWSE